MSGSNQPWNLESFVDALVVELDKTRETLSVKAINKPLSYTVKDMALDLQIFPTYDGKSVRFVTAQPGEVGSSQITMQLSTITDRQVRETSKQPPTTAELDLEEVDLDPEVKTELRKIGVTSVEDLDRIEKKGVKLESVVKKKIDYSDLAGAIRSSRRSQRPPRVRSATLSRDVQGNYRMAIEGEELAVDQSFEPVVVINGEPVQLVARERNRMTLAFPAEVLAGGDNDLIMVLDPYSVVRVNVRQGQQASSR